ncbi:MAG: FAD-dependent oxidoreductase [Lachnospiraceae bacterium]|nr:FAD-dependent oxidoreductase [Lachnospiraceae bacterium]
MKSVWEEAVEIGERKSLEGNLDVDVAVIGAGMAGILTAFALKCQGKNVVVLEADRIGSGQTGKTTAKITAQHGLIYHKMIRRYGVEKASVYARANRVAIDAFEWIVKERKIDCHFKRVPAYLYSTTDDRKLKKEAEAAEVLGIRAFFTRETELPFEVKGAVCFQDQAQFHPLLFVKEIAKELTIYEKTKVLSVRGHKIETEGGTVTAEHIVFATHYPITNLPGFYFLRQHQERSYVLAVSGVKRPEGIYYGIDKKGISFRSTEEALLLGGGGHRTGENKKGGAYEELVKAAEQYFPQYEEKARWSAQDCMPHDGIPFIGKYSVFRPYWYVATGFQKWGMTSSMLSAIIICDRICGRDNPYERLFKPQRFHFFASLELLLKDVGKSVKGLAKGFFHLPFKTLDSLPKGHGGIIRIGFRRFACYKDEHGNVHRILARCPHMGCELEWNPDELSWDCPCHGSRYDVDGKLLDCPAQKEKKFSVT